MTGITLRTPSLLGRSAFDHIFDQFFNDPAPMIKRSTDGYPVTDIYKDDEGNQVIEMALAGFTKDDISIEIKENTIDISCNRAEEKNSSRYQRKIARRSFTKKFVDYHNKLDLINSKAKFENGLLEIVIPHQKEAKSISIDIV